MSDEIDNASDRLASHLSGLEESLQELADEGLPDYPDDDHGDKVWLLDAGPEGPEDPVWSLIDGGEIFGDQWRDGVGVASPDESSGDRVEKSVFASSDPSNPGVAALGGDVVTLSPRHDPGMLHTLFRTSAHLRAPVDAYVTNIDSMGHTFIPLVEVEDDDDAQKAIRKALEFERRLEILDGTADGDPGSSLGVTDAEVDSFLESTRANFRFEESFLEYVFNSFSPGSTFTELRRRTREDIEVTGVGYWEVLRSDYDSAGRPVDGNEVPLGIPRYACHVPSPSIRQVVPSRDTATEVTYERVSALSVKEVERQKIFRRYVQAGYGQRRWFKEFGDPRVMSAMTGQYVNSLNDLGKDDCPANEIFQWNVYDPMSPTGSPRWIGALLSVQGSMAADRVNLDYFRAKPPAGMLLVTGGKLSKQVRAAIESKWKAFARGEERFHGLVVVEATSSARQPSHASGKVGIEFVPLTQTQMGDALFREYDSRNGEKVAITFRIPGIERGVQESSNRASAEVSVANTDKTVYQPLRKQFDDEINTKFLPAMGVTLWKFQTDKPDPKDYEAAKILSTAAEKTSIMDRNEQRRDFGEALNINLPPMDEAAQLEMEEESSEG